MIASLRWLRPLLLTTILFLSPCLAMAIDGVVEINQARAAAGGITPGDTPGLPITISEPGSYRLTSRIFGTTVISVQPGVTGVTIDLNGFEIDGGTGSGPGILGGDQTTIRNGNVNSFNGNCVEVGNSSRVENVRTEGCTVGILAGDHSVVARSIAVGHTDDGIRVGVASRLLRNVTEINTGEGFESGAAVVATRNVSRGNTGGGYRLGEGGVALDNLASGNGFGLLAGGRSVVMNNMAGSNLARGMEAGDDSVMTRNASSDNGGEGLWCGARCTVRENTASSNSGTGIVLGDGSTAAYNVATDNTKHGIDCDSGTLGAVCGIVGNSLISNDDVGLNMSLTTIGGSYKDNTINENSTADVSPPLRDPGFQNTCSGTSPCP